MYKPCVYIVDDDEELNTLIKHRFIVYGCDAETFTTPDVFYRAFDKKIPDLVLTDLNLEDGLSGFDIIRKLRNDKKSNVPIIILSGEKETTQVAHGIELGANEFIVKPPLKQQFDEILSKYLKTEKLQNTQAALFQQVPSSKRRAKLSFQLKIEEVQPMGLTLLSEHLVKKGTSFHLKGSELKILFPQSDQVFVSVIGSATKILPDKKIYQLFVEINPDQELALNEIRIYLDKKSSK